jgi:hypothetical protein
LRTKSNDLVTANYESAKKDQLTQLKKHIGVERGDRNSNYCTAIKSKEEKKSHVYMGTPSEEESNAN